MKRILVACDAGAAGRELLARQDIELAWGLTPAEIDGWLNKQRPDVVLIREEIAPEVLARVAEISHPPPALVLLDPDGWDRRDSYFNAGATALVQASSKVRILEAVSNLTGLTFASSARVPFRDVVEVTRRGDTALLETFDLSKSGVAIKSHDKMQVGERVSISFVMSDPSPRADGVVVRVHEHGDHVVVGVCFPELSDEDGPLLDELIEATLEQLPKIPDPVSMTGDLAGTFTIDLHTALAAVKKPEAAFREMLQHELEPQEGLESPRIPSWLRRVALALTNVERAALTTGAPAFASAAIDARIRIERARAAIDAQPMTQADCRSILDLCRTLASDADAAAKEVCGDVPVLRAALLSGVYGASQSTPEQQRPRKVA